MTALFNLVKSEPVAFAVLITAGIACGTAFGLSWSPGQVAAITTLWAALSGLFVRNAVSPVSAVEARAASAATVANPGTAPPAA